MKLKLWMALFVMNLTVPNAMATVLTFDEFDNGTRIDNEYYAEYGITFNGVNLDEGVDNLAVIFDTTLTNTADPDLEATFSNVNNTNLGTSDPGNVLIIQENPSSCNDLTCASPDDEGSRIAGYFSIDFETGITLNSIDFFDIEYNEATIDNAIVLYDMNNVELNVNEFYTPGTGGDNTWDTYYFNVSDVYSMEIYLNGSGAIDNLDITLNVPEPASIGLLSFALLGLIYFRRRTA